MQITNNGFKIHTVNVKILIHLQHDGVEWEDPLAVFTTTPEALYGVSHVALPTKHRLNVKKYYKVRDLTLH